MTSLYNQSVPVLIKYLKAFSGVLDKAVQYAEAKSVKHEDLLKARLIEDMRA